MIDGLSRGERRILSHLATGASNKAIATSLGITEYTVKTHVKAIIKKLNVENRTQVALACLNGRQTIATASLPNDLRAKGWSVAVHNDYRIDDVPHTFWLFTKDGRAVKGEGLTDAAALNQVRRLLGLEIPKEVL